MLKSYFGVTYFDPGGATRKMRPRSTSCWFAWFCEVGAGRLAATLARAPAFQARDVVPLCFSHEGYKQPQQLLILSYFLSIGQSFDVVVNIDGFNEVAISPLNDARGSDISMPSVMHMDPLTALVDQS